MSTDTRDALIERLEYAVGLPSEWPTPDEPVTVPASLWVRHLRDVHQAARLLREDGERGGREATSARDLLYDVVREAVEAVRNAGGSRLTASQVAAVAVESDRARRLLAIAHPAAAPDRRAALSALYLEAHRAGVEAAAVLAGNQGHTGAYVAIWESRDDLAEEVRAYLADESNWTDPGSALAKALAHPAAGGEARERPIRASQDVRVTLAATIYAAQNAMEAAIAEAERTREPTILPGMDEAFERADALLAEWGVEVDPPGDPVEEIAGMFRRAALRGEEVGG